jgi:ankyrin repeat protein
MVPSLLPQGGHRIAATLLLDKGAVAGAANADGRTPLHFAAMQVRKAWTMLAGTSAK